MLEMLTAGAKKAPVVTGTIASVGTGQQDVAVLTTTGNVYAIGTSNFTGNGSTSSNWVKVTDNVAQMATAFRAVFLMKKDGTFWFVGNNNYFPLGLSTTVLTNVTSYFSSLLAGKTVKKIALTHTTLGVLCTDGTVILSGTNANGGCGVGNTTAQKVPAILSSITDAVDIGFDNYTADTTYILRQGGIVYGAGNSDYGQLGNLSTTTTSFRQITPTTNILKIVPASSGIFMFLRNSTNGIGNIAIMGRQFGGSLGTGATGNTNYTTLTNVVTVPASSPDPQIFTGAYHGRYWLDNTKPYYTGTSGAFVGCGSVFNNTTRYSFTAQPVSSFPWESYDATKTNYNNSFVVSGGKLYGAGVSASILAGTTGDQPVYTLLNTDVVI